MEEIWISSSIIFIWHDPILHFDSRPQFSATQHFDSRPQFSATQHFDSHPQFSATQGLFLGSIVYVDNFIVQTRVDIYVGDYHSISTIFLHGFANFMHILISSMKHNAKNIIILHEKTNIELHAEVNFILSWIVQWSINNIAEENILHNIKICFVFVVHLQILLQSKKTFASIFFPLDTWQVPN